VQHHSFVVHTSRGEVQVFVDGTRIAQIIPVDAKGVAEKESFDEYEGAAELTELLVRHANLPESEAERRKAKAL
jgi:hypothetical protein